MNLLGAVKFPPIENVIEWPAWLFEDSTYFAFNKIAFIHFLGLVIPMAVFLLGARGSGLVPRGFRTVSEGIVTFVDEQIAKPGIGHGREPYLPLLVSFFLFIFIGN
ncbi:MAG: F0F1 ATP synthase subunit A, partial [Acidimicrobiales bacterium]